MVDLAEVSAQTGGGTPTNGLRSERRAYSQRRVEQLLRRARDFVDDFHEANPLRPGIPKASLAERLRIDVEDLDTVIAAADDLLTDGPTVRATAFGDALDGQHRVAWESLRDEMRAAGFSPPRRKEIEIERELMHALVRGGHLIEVSDELVYLPETLDALEVLVRAMPPGFSVADFRDGMAITRKYAVPLLEWMDAQGVTRREGDGRVVRPPQRGEPAPDDAPSR